MLTRLAGDRTGEGAEVSGPTPVFQICPGAEPPYLTQWLDKRHGRGALGTGDFGSGREHAVLGVNKDKPWLMGCDF